MKSQVTWDESNRYAANAMIMLAAVGAALVLIFRYLVVFPFGPYLSKTFKKTANV